MARLRKHADYQRVYASSRKQFSKQMAFFYSMRPPEGPDGKPRRSETPGPRIGLTVGKVMGKAVDRNRIKRRLRECIRRNAALLSGPVDVILHPRRAVIDIEFAILDREVAQVFRTVQAGLRKEAAKAATEKIDFEAGKRGPGAKAPLLFKNLVVGPKPYANPKSKDSSSSAASKPAAPAAAPPAPEEGPE